MAIKP